MLAIDYLRSQGFEAQARGDKILITPREKLTDDIREFVKSHRDELLRQLEISVTGLRSYGIELLPDDHRFILRRTSIFSASQTSRILSEYRDRWLHAMLKEPVEHKKQNVGRYAANCWLRELK